MCALNDIEILPDLPKRPRSRCEIFSSNFFSKAKQIERLKETAEIEFLELTKGIGDKNILDYYHIWTALNSECSVFLTTDKSLTSNFRSLPTTIRTAFAQVRVLLPSELGKELGLHPVPHQFVTPLNREWLYDLRIPQIIEKHA